MKLKNYFVIPILLLLLLACSPKIKSVIGNERQPLAYDSEVYILTLEQTVPENMVAVGELSIGDTGFSVNCNYKKTLARARLKARENGANIVKITEHKTPDFWSSCHRIKAQLYFTDDINQLGGTDQRP